ncbi:MAG: hypothetical protein QOH72_145 [Solirubrobacteraceae bacterium]|jgi:hypothetical protein|nr:hypothetical protein [Solirubrobacteraceae bacterium]
MPTLENRATRATVRANATVRLCCAREALWRVQRRHAGARGTPAEAWTFQRLGEAAAEVGTREQWLHWVEHGTTIRPVADGEWGFVPDAEDLRPERSPARRRLRAVI